MSKFIIKAQVDEFTPERIAMTVSSRKEAIERLNRAFGRPVNGCYTDSLGQKFWIEEHKN